jgi:hypothetical protein
LELEAENYRAVIPGTLPGYAGLWEADLEGIALRETGGVTRPSPETASQAASIAEAAGRAAIREAGRAPLTRQPTRRGKAEKSRKKTTAKAGDATKAKAKRSQRKRAPRRRRAA